MYRGLPVRVYGPSSFFRRELYECCQKSGCGFDTNLHYMMDIDLWERFRKAGFWHHKLARYVWGFRVHGASLTSEDLLGRTPFEMDREYQLLDRRYGTLPTLSDNFGLVVAEALERGKPVVTTDGAPAWKDEPRTDAHGHTRLVFLEGFRDGTDARRVQLLRQAIESFLRT